MEDFIIVEFYLGEIIKSRDECKLIINDSIELDFLTPSEKKHKDYVEKVNKNGNKQEKQRKMRIKDIKEIYTLGNVIFTNDYVEQNLFDEVISYLKNVNKLYFEDVQITDELLNKINSAQSLKELALLQYSTPQILDKIPNVKKIILLNLKIQDINLGSKTKKLILVKCDLNEMPDVKGLKELILNSNEIKRIREDLTNYLDLNVLSLRNNIIRNVNYNIIQLKQLTTLDLSYNKIKSLPDSICGLTNMKILKLDHNELTTLPKFIGLLNCKQITLNNNKLISLPESLSDMKLLKKIDVSHNLLTKIKYSFFSSNLKVINLSHNKITKVPVSIDVLKNLELLDLSFNGIEELPETFHLIETIETLLLNNNYIFKIPYKFATVIVNYLNLSHNNLVYVPDEFNTNIIELNLSNNLIQVTPFEISYIASLERLNISNNQIEYLNVLNMSNLTELIADNNEINDINVSLYRNKKLELLSLKNNKIENISEDIIMLQSLKTLNINDNNLTNLPNSIYKFKCAVFDGNFSNNSLTSVSEEIIKLNCTYLNFSNNKLEEFPDIFTDKLSINLDNNRLKLLPKSVTYVNKISIKGNKNLKLTSRQKNSLKNKYFSPLTVERKIYNTKFYEQLRRIQSINIKLIDIINQHNMAPMSLVEFDDLLTPDERERMTYENTKIVMRLKKPDINHIFNKSKDNNTFIKILSTRINVSKTTKNKFLDGNDDLVEEIQKETQGLDNPIEIIDILKKYYSDL